MTEPTIGTIPQSNALEEVQVDSLSELFSRDPEKFGQGDLKKIISELRAQRERLEAAERAGEKVPRAKKTETAKKSGKELLGTKVNATLEDLLK